MHSGWHSLAVALRVRLGRCRGGTFFLSRSEPAPGSGEGDTYRGCYISSFSAARFGLGDVTHCRVTRPAAPQSRSASLAAVADSTRPGRTRASSASSSELAPGRSAAAAVSAAAVSEEEEEAAAAAAEARQRPAGGPTPCPGIPSQAPTPPLTPADGHRPRMLPPSPSPSPSPPPPPPPRRRRRRRRSGGAGLEEGVGQGENVRREVRVLRCDRFGPFKSRFKWACRRQSGQLTQSQTRL